MPPRSIPPFRPELYYEEGIGEVYEDGRVSGSVDSILSDTGKAIVIHEWSSCFPGHGHTKEALEWLRSQGFTRIVANGAGQISEGVGDISTLYWQHMHTLGLVDVLLDDEGRDITPASQKGD